jgi:23S rRNA G2445 N2-methylase RlmL
MDFALPHNLVSLLNFFADYTGSKQVRKGLKLIWNAVVWSVWLHRNKVVFENGLRNIAEVWEGVKTISWQWWIKKSNSIPCMFYEWNQAPIHCLSR